MLNCSSNTAFSKRVATTKSGSCLATSVVKRGGPVLSMSSNKTAKIVKKEELAATRWLRFVNLHYTLEDGGKEMTWQSCERTTTEPGKVDAVAVFAVVKSKKEEPKLLIVKQFRPPLGKYTVELCAGLVDPGEGIEASALRELKEETGFVGKVVGVTGKQYLSPGLTPECLVTVFVEVDKDAPENANPIQAAEDQGAITLGYLPLNTLFEALKELEEKQGYCVWVGLYSIAQGMRINKLMGIA